MKNHLEGCTSYKFSAILGLHHLEGCTSYKFSAILGLHRGACLAALTIIDRVGKAIGIGLAFIQSLEGAIGIVGLGSVGIDRHPGA